MVEKKMKQGLLYVATGTQYVKEACQSIQSFEFWHPDIPSVIYTDPANERLAKNHFSEVRLIKAPVFNFLDKIEPLIDSPFERTLFLDSDTYCCENINSLWSLLDDHELAFSFDTGRINDQIDDVPVWFSEYSTGVILYKNSESFKSLVLKWKETYLNLFNTKGITFDQTSFRKVLWELKPNFFVLPNEYNFYTFSFNISAKDYPVKIFHGRYTNIEQAVSHLKSDIPTLYANDMRFLNSNSFKSFNYHQTNTWLFKLIINLFNLYYRISSRLGLSKSALYHKKKGNSESSK